MRQSFNIESAWRRRISAARLRHAPLALAFVGASGALLISGCSGSSSSSHSVVRVTNAIAQAGQLEMIINSGSVNGTQKYAQTSGYLYFPSDGVSTAKYVLSDYSALTYPSGDFTFNVTGTNPYTLVAYGNPAIQSTDSPVSPNILVLTDYTGAIPSGTAMVRVVNVAPDAGSINFSLGGVTEPSVGYGLNSGYLPMTTGEPVLTVASVTTGGTLFSETLKLSSGNAYTILVSEPTLVVTTNSVTTGTTTYGTIILNDR